MEISGISLYYAELRYFRLSTQTKQGHAHIVQYGQLLSCFFMPCFLQSISAVLVFDSVMVGILSPMSWTVCLLLPSQSINSSAIGSSFINVQKPVFHQTFYEKCRQGEAKVQRDVTPTGQKNDLNMYCLN